MKNKHNFNLAARKKPRWIIWSIYIIILYYTIAFSWLSIQKIQIKLTQQSDLLYGDLTSLLLSSLPSSELAELAQVYHNRYPNLSPRYGELDSTGIIWRYDDPFNANFGQTIYVFESQEKASFKYKHVYKTFLETRLNISDWFSPSMIEHPASEEFNFLSTKADQQDFKCLIVRTIDATRCYYIARYAQIIMVINVPYANKDGQPLLDISTVQEIVMMADTRLNQETERKDD